MVGVASVAEIPRETPMTEWAGCRLTPRSSGRGDDKVPSPYSGSHAAQLDR
jgi:hypothetical protein